jgi:5-formyltetrahydrofolate cyclo-ligase
LPVVVDRVSSKADWRQRARQARAGLAIDSGLHCAGIARYLAAGRSSGEVRPGWTVGYLAMAGEVDLAPLLAIDELGPFAITRTPDTGDDLTVHPLDSPRERHWYGFDQPAAGSVEVRDDDIAVVLVPGLAFDRLGGRLGHGKGYYDRLLARLQGRSLLIGITGGYIVAELPTEAHDVPMTHLAGEFGVMPSPLDEPVDLGAG